MRDSASHNQPNLVFLNGNFVSKADATVSVFDRSFMYGDGIFETVRAANGRLFAFAEHFARFVESARALRLQVEVTVAEVGNAAVELLERNHLSGGMLRFQLSRGIGARGYSTLGADSPVFVMTAHPATTPKREVHLITSSHPLPPLSQHKTCNRLVHVLAKIEAESAQADDALFLTSNGFVAECTASNIFWMEGDTLCTPALTIGCLPGVTRQLVLELWGRSPRAECPDATLDRVLKSDGVFVTSSAVDVAEALSINGVALPRSCAIADLQEAFALHVEKCLGG